MTHPHVGMWVGCHHAMVVWCADRMVTLYGVAALSFMMAMYALEPRGRRFVLAFALGCALSSTYGFLSGAWPFGVVEAIWYLVAVRRYPHPSRHRYRSLDRLVRPRDYAKRPFPRAEMRGMLVA